MASLGLMARDPAFCPPRRTPCWARLWPPLRGVAGSFVWVFHTGVSSVAF